MKLPSLAAGLVIALSVATAAHAAPTVNTSDFIADGTRTGFNGFEVITNDGTFYTGGAGPYTEGGISVRQVNADEGNDIWVTYSSGGQHQGSYSWYPSGGDFGYTEISLFGGGDFSTVGMLLGSGFGTPSYYFYELLDGGSVVLAGYLTGSFSQYLGFSGGGFDTIRLADCSGCVASDTGVTDGHFQALAVDSIEVTGGGVPVGEAGRSALAAVAVIGLGLRRGRRV